MVLLDLKYQDPVVRSVIDAAKKGRKPSQHTWTNSTGDVSPRGLWAETLVAGKALGTMFTEVRFRGFVTTKEDMLTAKQSRSVRVTSHNLGAGLQQDPRARRGKGRTTYIYSGLSSREQAPPRACC